MTDETPSREGELLAGKYRLQGRLGVGGMGEVYRARNEFVGRDVAIKVLRPELCRHAEVVQRFLREARAANAVRHDNVVDVIDMGTDDHNIPFIVQELLVGQDLSHHLVARGNRLPTDEILALMIPVVDAIATAHQHGVVHRDLKPENVFLTNGRQGVVPKVLDFGISKIVQPGEEKLTATGTAMGTPTYMSPEQVQGASDLDARADVWALGVMLYELATGVLPFNGPSAGAIFVSICTRDPAPMHVHSASVPPDYARVVERCLQRDLGARYPSAAALLRDLHHVQNGERLSPTESTASAPHANVDLDTERLSIEARAYAGGTMVGGAAPAIADLLPPNAPPVATPTPTLAPSPSPRRVAPLVGASIALVAALGLGAFALSNRQSSTTVPPRPPPPVLLRPRVEPIDAALARTPIAEPAAPTAPAVAATTASVGEEDGGGVLEPASTSARRGHGRRHAVRPASEATVGLPPPPPPPHRSTGVGTTEYE